MKSLQKDHNYSYKLILDQKAIAPNKNIEMQQHKRNLKEIYELKNNIKILKEKRNEYIKELESFKYLPISNLEFSSDDKHAELMSLRSYHAILEQNITKLEESIKKDNENESTLKISLKKNFIC